MSRNINVVRTRFCPSPTGFLHVGGVRTALFAYLVAKQAGGQFILRIEDTDKKREVVESEKHIFDSLKWLGISWDEGPDNEGHFGPYRQSERLGIYKEWVLKLLESGRAYPDPYSENELEEFRSKAKSANKPFLFRDYRPREYKDWDGKLALRLKSDPKPYKWHDLVLGDLSTGPEAIDDFIILKSDGFPTYNFAHIIDDHLMQISHVIRSQEFLASVPKYLNLYEALNIDRPELATLPYVMAPGGKRKLSKRDGAKDILDYKRLGYLPEAIINFLATLGWNDGTEKEIFSIDELVEKFSLDRVHKGGANFDENRLTWMNGHYIRSKSIDELYKLAETYWPAQAENFDKEYKKQVLSILQDRIKFLSEIKELSKFFFIDPDDRDVIALYENPLDKQLAKESLDNESYINRLRLTLNLLEYSDFSEEDIQNKLNELLDKTGLKPAILFPIIRIAISGAKSTPALAATLKVLGKKRTIQRIKTTLSNLEK